MKKKRRASRPARERTPAIGDLREDHRYEQFFFDLPTTRRLTRLACTAQDPLLVCLPSIAVALAEQDRPARLLDRDKRFSSLPRMQRFDLLHPDYIDGRHDLLMCDPPFANVELARLVDTLDLLFATAMMPSQEPALALCYISSRDSALKSAFAAYDLQAVGAPLGYRSVSSTTQSQIRLYLSRGARSQCASP